MFLEVDRVEGLWNTKKLQFGERFCQKQKNSHPTRAYPHLYPLGLPLFCKNKILSSAPPLPVLRRIPRATVALQRRAAPSRTRPSVYSPPHSRTRRRGPAPLPQHAAADMAPVGSRELRRGCKISRRRWALWRTRAAAAQVSSTIPHPLQLLLGSRGHLLSGPAAPSGGFDDSRAMRKHMSWCQSSLLDGYKVCEVLVCILYTSSIYRIS
jgi:hypothetical protein